MMSDFAFLGTETAAAWDEWHLENAVVDAGSVHLATERFPAYVDPRELVELDAMASPVVDIEVDDCDILYLLRASGHVERYDAGTGRLDRLGCAPVGAEAGVAVALSVTPDTIYVASADDPGPDGYVTAIAKYPEQRRWQTTLADASPVAMVDAGGTADADGRVYLLVETPASGSLVIVEPSGAVRTVLTDLLGPLDVAVDPAGIGYLLSRPTDRPELRRVDTQTLDPDAPTAAPSAWAAPVPSGASALAVGADDELLVGRDDTAAGKVTLFRARGTGRDALSSLDTDVARLHLADRLYAVESGGRVVRALDPKTRYATHGETGDHVAVLTRRFDSGEQATAWHRVTMGLDAAAAGTQVRLEYAATDASGETAHLDWQEIEPANPHDALFAEAVGRYLHLRITLKGDRFSSPSVHAMRVYFPQQSYLRHLPGIYQQDADSRVFLDRFLAIFESTFVGVEEDLSEITQYLDPAGTSTEFVDWLGEWLALAPDETWPEPARRELIAAAHDLFKARGTPDGLLRLLAIYLAHVSAPSDAWEAWRDRQLDGVDHREGADLSPADARTLRRRIQSDVFLLEYSDLDCADGPTREAYERLLGCPQCFFVFVRPFVTDEQFETIQRLVDDHRPAHAVGRAVELEPSVVLGGHTYLGVNSVLPDRDLVVGEGALGRDLVLETRTDAGRLGVRTTLGEDTELS